MSNIGPIRYIFTILLFLCISVLGIFQWLYFDQHLQTIPIYITYFPNVVVPIVQSIVIITSNAFSGSPGTVLLLISLHTVFDGYRGRMHQRICYRPCANMCPGYVTLIPFCCELGIHSLLVLLPYLPIALIHFIDKMNTSHCCCHHFK